MVAPAAICSSAKPLSRSPNGLQNDLYAASIINKLRKPTTNKLISIETRWFGRMKPKRAHRLLPLHKAGMEEQLAAVETAKYVPSPMDYSLLVPQLLGMGFLAVCLAYYQLVLAPTAQVKFSMSDKDKRARIREKIADESKPFQRWLYRLWLKPLARPRGDQTRGGTVIPGLTDTQGSSAKSSKSGNTERGD